VKTAILRDKKLKEYFKENPQEREAVKKGTRKQTRTFRYMRNVPDYLLPQGFEREKPETYSVHRKTFQSNMDRRYGTNTTDQIDDDERLEEDPKFISAEDLPPISGRKKWKIRHRFALKKTGRGKNSQ
jgi:hypothetical protein